MQQGGHLYTQSFVLGAQDVRWLRKEHVHNILDMILMYDREAKYDPTLEETSDELLRLLLDEIKTYFQAYYGTGSEMVAKKKRRCLYGNYGIAPMQKAMSIRIVHRIKMAASSKHSRRGTRVKNECVA